MSLDYSNTHTMTRCQTSEVHCFLFGFLITLTAHLFKSYNEKNKQFSRRKEVLKHEMSRFCKSRRAKGFHKIGFSVGVRAIPLNDKLFENKDKFAFIESLSHEIWFDTFDSKQGCILTVH